MNCLTELTQVKDTRLSASTMEEAIPYLFFFFLLIAVWGFLGGTVVKNPPANAGDAGSIGLISVSGRSPGEGSGNPLRYSYVKNPMDRGAW